MLATQKKSQINHWWVAEENRKMSFVNILSKEELIGNYLIVGYFEDGTEIATSTNYVKRITKKGVQTAKGAFYPFEEAHELYLQFLIEANKENILIAQNWKKVSNLPNQRIIADIIYNGKIKTDIEFDFTPDTTSRVLFSGYSKKLNSRVVITTFDRRQVCIRMKIPNEIRDDIYTSSFFGWENPKQKLRKIHGIFNNNINKSYKSVEQF